MKIKIVKLFKNYLNILQRNVDISLTPYAYFCTWRESDFSRYINYRIKGNTSFFLIIKILLKNCLELFKTSKIISYNIDENRKLKINKIILSWCLIKDFNKDYYFDRYLNLKSTNTKNLWLLISQDKKIPKKIPKNVIILSEKKIINLFNFITFFKLNIKYIFFYLNKETQFAISLNNFISNFIQTEKIKFKSFLMPYEAQPFQNYIFSNIHAKFPLINTEGYVHSGLVPSLFYMEKRKGSPKKIFVHGISYKKIMLRLLGWKMNDIKVIKSLRYKPFKKNFYKKKIFLPYATNELEIIKKNFSNLARIYDLSNYEIKDHPVSKLKENYNLKNFITNQINNHKIKKKYSEFPICIGVSQIIFEILESGNDVIHIYIDEVNDSLNNKIWRGILSQKINKNTSIYRLEKKKMYILT